MTSKMLKGTKDILKLNQEMENADRIDEEAEFEINWSFTIYNVVFILKNASKNVY